MKSETQLYRWRSGKGLVLQRPPTRTKGPVLVALHVRSEEELFQVDRLLNEFFEMGFCFGRCGNLLVQAPVLHIPMFKPFEDAFHQGQSKGYLEIVRTARARKNKKNGGAA